MPMILEQLTQKFAKKKSRLYAGGPEGEAFARRWLTANKWTWVAIDQTPEQLCEELKALDGKRPDYAAAIDADYFLLLDAKHHTTHDCQRFALSVTELTKYRVSNDYMMAKFLPPQPGLLIETWFMVFPKECEGRRVVFVELSEMEGGERTTFPDGSLGKWISLENRSKWWADNPE
jgi:hypothetical protein